MITGKPTPPPETGRSHVMTRSEALKILADHQHWRKGDDSYPSTNPKHLTAAIDFALEALTQPPQEGGVIPEQTKMKKARGIAMKRKEALKDLAGL